MVEVVKFRVVKTRKPHKCFGCCREFPKGTLMECQTVRSDTELYPVYLCATCQIVSENTFEPGEEYEEGQIKELVEEYEKRHNV